ncbi:MAG: hypothetical protein KBA71_12410 [Opitutaceae bacterium]|nr:hypothetical protein [Opitutaceae bacterium]
MISKFACNVLAGLAVVITASAVPAGAPTGDPALWVVEQMPGGTVTMKGGVMEIRDKAGCTIWWREKLTAPVEIEFTVTPVQGPTPTDRVSDLNCFWMAQETNSTDAPFAPGNARSGKFSQYDSLFTYYVGYGANNNTTTRFRRYDGTSLRPLLPEHDLSDQKYMLTSNRPVRIRLAAREGVAEFWRDGERVFRFEDPHPLISGWFGFRTVKSHLRISDFSVVQGTKEATGASGTRAALP